MTIKIDTETISKIACLANQCKNFLWQPVNCCNLKHIVISEKGQCESYDPIGDDKVSDEAHRRIEKLS